MPVLVRRTSPLLVLLAVALACAGPTEVEVLPPIAEGDLAPAQVDTGSGSADEGEDGEVVPGDSPAEEEEGDGAVDGEPTEEVSPDEPAAQPRTGQRRRRAPRPTPRPAPAPAPRAAPEAGTGEAPDEEPAPAPAPAPKVKPPAPAPPGITQVDESTWNVTQRLVDKWQDDPYTLGNVREKDPGWELVGIRQRNAYHLGMRNLDVVLEVNGRKLNTMPQLLAAYLALKNDKAFDVVFVRGGVRKVHHYRIVN